MNYLHYECDVGTDETIEVALDNAANVLLLDSSNYADYQAGRSYRYHGGHVKTSPFRLRPPREGHWHLVVDLGGSVGAVRAAVRVVKAAVAQGA